MRKVTKQLLTTAIFLTLFFLPKEGMSQKPSDAQLEDALYACLFNKINKPNISSGYIVGNSLSRDPSDHTRAFDSESGRNFVYDKKKQAWIDTKTGESITAPNLEDALFCCLFNKINKPNISSGYIVGNSLSRDPSDHTRAFDSESGRNFFYDKKKQAWIDSKTGECICPKCSPTETTKKDSSAKTTENIGSTNFPHKDIFIGFSLIREDNGSNGFNTYGGEFAYTRNLCRRGGITGDVGVNLGSFGTVDYTKINILAGGTYYPIRTAVPASDFSFSVHALAGLSNIRSNYGSSSFSNSYFTMDVGGGFNYYFGDKTGVGLRIGYMPTFGKGNTSNNFRVGLGLDFR